MGKLTAVKVRNLGPGMHGDGDGLYLRVVTAERRSWAFRYQRRGKSREMGLGGFPAVSLALARDKADAARKLLGAGIDPIDQREADRLAEAAEQAHATTFAEAASAYIEANQSGWRSGKTETQWRNTLANYAQPVLGTLACNAIETNDVLKVLKPIWAKKPETATRVRRRIEAVLSYAKTRGWRDGENPAAWRDHLALVLPARSKVAPVVHHPALDWQDAPAFMAALRAREGMGARALEFAILTAARSGEVRRAQWSEIHLDRAEWITPAARMKAAKDHRVPLSEPALAVLRKIAAFKDGSGLVFLGQSRGVPMSDMTLTAVLRRMGNGDRTVHGFRSTFSDWAGKTTAHPNHVVEQALAHAIPSAVEAAYRRGDLFAKRRALMEDWANYLAKPAEQVVRPRFGQQAAAHEVVA
ncbi:MAG: integrase arm-type DNA-binding domain-containing protein [Betaproteobacteria bacterium]|nr:integrase arm-type DNA-binding domain-containing protein [Betaproteobacteria bacterium]